MKVASGKIAYFVSSHGFGHATRTAAIITEIHKQAPQLHFIIISGMPANFWKVSLSPSLKFTCHSMKTDIGMIQKDSFKFDLSKTITSLKKYLLKIKNKDFSLPALLEVENADHVISDISPIGLAFAKYNGIKSTLVENFTWDWIYQEYVNENKEFLSLSSKLHEVFASADSTIQVTPFCELKNFASQTKPVYRYARTESNITKRQLGLNPKQDFTLISTGGIGYDYKCLELLKKRDEVIVICRDQNKITRSENLIYLPLKSDFYFPDLVKASSQVIGKVGYGTVVESWGNGKRFCGITRDKFRESDILKDFIIYKKMGQVISVDEFDSGEWIESFFAKEAKENKISSPRQAGNKEVADLILKNCQ